MVRKTGFGLLVGAVLAVVVAVAGAGDITAGPQAEPQVAPAEGGTSGPVSKPRFELYIPSIRTLLEQTARSHSGAFLAPARSMLLELGTVSSEGVDATEALGLLEQIKGWPDTAIRAATYAPDTEGRARWVVQFDWPLEALHDRVAALLSSEAAKTILEGVTLAKCDGGEGYEIALPGMKLAYLLPARPSGLPEAETAPPEAETGSPKAETASPEAGTRPLQAGLGSPAADKASGVGRRASGVTAFGACLASHPDLGVLEGFTAGGSQEQGESPPLLTCRLNLAGTEQDSGATGFSAFRAVTAVEYQARIDEQGDWTEDVSVLWPPVSGLGAKAIFGKVKQTFFVPDTAFGAAVFESGLAVGMLDALVGFGPQVMMEDPGELSVVGEAAPGPIASRAGSQACVTLLPGTGFIPFPDVVVQLQTKRPEELVKDVRAAVEKANKVYKDREQPEPWHEGQVRDRPVFWSDGGGRYGAAMMPLSLRPVLTVVKELDARERERDILLLAWTSTAPEDLVRRWLDLPRGQDRRFLPSSTKTSGQAWLNWLAFYKWVSPYLNVGLSGLGVETLLPEAEAIRADLTDAEVTAKLKYSGLALSHRGPLPAGAVLLPALVGASLVPDESGGSDLARERLACERLRVLYHHCKLFQKDRQRWPAELAELDGYVDFAGHPELLELQLSSKRRWLRWLEEVAEATERDKDKDKEDAEEEDQWSGLDTDLYVIDWGREHWTLGFEPGTFEHLEKLYIDQDGRIHRVVKQAPAEAKKDQAAAPPVGQEAIPKQDAEAKKDRADEPAIRQDATSKEAAEEQEDRADEPAVD